MRVYDENGRDAIERIANALEEIVELLKETADDLNVKE